MRECKAVKKRISHTPREGSDISAVLLASSEIPVVGNLGEADVLISTGSLDIHFLPVLMTLINCISGVVYTKGKGMAEKVQVFITAAVFLIILHPMPSGLVIYWTFNNFFRCLN